MIQCITIPHNPVYKPCSLQKSRGLMHDTYITRYKGKIITTCFPGKFTQEFYSLSLTRSYFSVHGSIIQSQMTPEAEDLKMRKFSLNLFKKNRYYNAEKSSSITAYKRKSMQEARSVSHTRSTVIMKW